MRPNTSPSLRYSAILKTWRSAFTAPFWNGAVRSTRSSEGRTVSESTRYTVSSTAYGSLPPAARCASSALPNASALRACAASRSGTGSLPIKS